MKRMKIAAAVLLAALMAALLPAAAAEGYMSAAGLAPAYYPDGGQTSKDTSLEREYYYTPSAALAPAFYPNDPMSGYDSGPCGTNVLYYFDKKTKILGFAVFENVIGNGGMWDYRLPSDTSTFYRLPPWHEKGYAGEIKEIIFAEGVKSVGANAFYGCENVDFVTISASITFVGPNAFYGMALKGLTFLGITPPVLDQSAFHPPADSPSSPSIIHYPANANGAYERLIDSGANNWSDLASYTREPFQGLAYVPLESPENDTPMIYDVEFDGEAISYSVYVQSANSAQYAGAIVRVTYNEKSVTDITLDLSGKGYGSFPAQQGEANFSLALLSYPSTYSNRHYQIIKPGMITPK